MDILVHPASTENASGNSVSFNSGNMGVTGLFVNVLGVSGTLPTLVVSIQHSPDNVTWYNVPNLITASLANVTSTSIMLGSLTSLAPYVRCVWTLGGVNPNFTFSADLVTFPL